MSAVGAYLTDGTVTWIIEDATQADAVGDITLHPTLLPGHVLANGATVKASEYPRLLAWVLDNAMTGEDDAHYTYDKSADTLKLPNAKGRVLQGGEAVKAMEAGLPNITGAVPIETNTSAQAKGAFRILVSGSSTVSSTAASLISNHGYPNLDASRCSSIYGASDTVQPPAITMLAQIKY